MKKLMLIIFALCVLIAPTVLAGEGNNWSSFGKAAWEGKDYFGAVAAYFFLKGNRRRR